MKLAELLPDYLNYAILYKKSYTSDLSKVKNYILPRLGNAELHEINRRDIASYIHGLDRLKPSTRNRHLALLKAIFSWAVEYDYLEVSPAAGIKAFREPSSLRRAMEPEEFSIFIRVLKAEIQAENRDTLQLLSLLAFTGMRLGEARSACIEDLNLTRNTLFLRDTKSGDSRLVPLCGEAMEIVCSQLTKHGNQGLLFRSAHGTKVAEPRRLMKKICEKAGIVPFTIHELRYTAGSAMLAATRDLYAVKRFLGHKCLSTSERYANYFSGQQHADIEKAMSIMLKP